MVTFTCRISEHGEIVVGDEIATVLKSHAGSIVQCTILNQSDELVQRIAEMQALEEQIVIAGLSAPSRLKNMPDEVSKLRGMC